MRRFRLALAICALAIIAGAAWWLSGAPTSVTLTRDDLQREVEKKFPIEKTELLFTATLSEPQVILKPQSDRIGIGVTIQVSAPVLKPLSGRGELDGVVRFDPTSRELFLDSPDLKIIEASGMSQKDVRSAEDILRPLLGTLLSRVALYKLKPSDLRQPLTDATVKEIHVESGVVVMRFAR